MGFSIGSVLSEIKSVVTDPGKLVSEAANSILPGNMKAVGDILGGITDINSGNPLAALSHLTDALKDLPQLLQSLSGGAAGASKPAGTAAAEPSPPPTTTNQSSAAGSASSTTAPTPQSPKVNVQTFGKETVLSIDDGTRTTVIVDKPGQKPLVSVHTDRGPTSGASAPAAGSTPPASTPAPGAPTAALAASTTADNTPADNTTADSTTASGAPPAGTTPAGTTAAPTPQAPKVNVQRIGRETTTSIDDGMRTTVIVQRPGHRPIVRTHADRLSTLPTAPAGSGTVSAASTKPATTSNAPAASPAETSSSISSASEGATSTPASASSSAGEGATSTPASASSTSSSAATPADLQSLMAMSPDQFMQAVTSGKIPDSVANSQSAMMQVQARMNQITQMNQLVTGMMAAMHQMEMSIIQNIRC